MELIKGAEKNLRPTLGTQTFSALRSTGPHFARASCQHRVQSVQWDNMGNKRPGKNMRVFSECLHDSETMSGVDTRLPPQPPGSGRGGGGEDSSMPVGTSRCTYHILHLLMAGGGGTKRTGGGGVSRQVKFAVVNFTVGNFAEPPGLSVSPPARVHSVYCWCARISETPEFRWEISRSIRNAKFPTQN